MVCYFDIPTSSCHLLKKMTNKFWEANEHAKLIGTIISGDSYIGWYHSTVVEEKSPFDLPLLLRRGNSHRR